MLYECMITWGFLYSILDLSVAQIFRKLWHVHLGRAPYVWIHTRHHDVVWMY